MRPHQLLLLTLLQLLSCCWAAQPRQLLSCPTDFATLVEPLPEAAGDPLLLIGPGLQLRTVGFLQDSVLVMESSRVLVNRSAVDLMQQQGPYNGPHVMLCSDSRQSMVSFSVYIKVALKETDSRTLTESAGLTTAPGPQSAGSPLLAVIVAGFALLVALCLGLAIALVLALRRRRRSYGRRQQRKIFIAGGSWDLLPNGGQEQSKRPLAYV